MPTYNLYVDESCHLENDKFPVMCIGYVKTPEEEYARHRDAIKEIKNKHNTRVEIKWSQVSSSRLALYKEMIDYFFAHNLFFRCILVKYKDKLEKTNAPDAHDKFYYNLIYFLLNASINPSGNHYRVYLDIKDTRGRDKLKKIYERLSAEYDHHSPFVHFQHIHSDQNMLLQLTDLFIGAVTYKARGEHKKDNASPAKRAIIEYLETKFGYWLDEGTEPWEEKFNIFDHQPKQQ